MLDLFNELINTNLIHYIMKSRFTVRNMITGEEINTVFTNEVEAYNHLRWIEKNNENSKGHHIVHEF